MAESGFDSNDRDYTEIVVVLNSMRYGHVDVELNDEGRQEAVRVAERLSKEAKISYVFSSDLRRAFENVHIISATMR